jgi:hypothetical protein
MRTLARRCAPAALLASLAACASTTDHMVQLSTDMAESPCMPGEVQHAVNTGLFTTASVSKLNDECNVGLTPDSLSAARFVMVDAMRRLTLTSKDSTTNLGSGQLLCNTAMLTASAAVTDTNCTYDAARTAMVQVTGDNRLTVAFSETRSNHMSAPGHTCTQPAECTIGFTITLEK